MVDRAELRKLVEASLKAEETWHHEADLHGSLAHTYGESGDYFVAPDAAYIAAASPDVFLGLLDEIDAQEQAAIATEEIVHKLGEERDQLREAAKHALVIVANLGRELGVAQSKIDTLREVAVRLKLALQELESRVFEDGAPDDVLEEVQGILADPEVEKL